MDKVKRLNQLRGILAICVFLDHLWINTGMLVFLPFNKFVTIAVSYFFSLSGYSMMKAYSADRQYLNKIWKVKIPYLIYLSIVAYCTGMLLEYVLYKNRLQCYFPISVRNFFSTTNWYIYELLCFYGLFIICMKFFSKEKGIVIIGIGSVIGFLILFAFGIRGGIISETYYDSIIGFWVGVFLSYRDTMNRKNKKLIEILVSVAFVVLGIAFLIFAKDHTTIWFAIARNLAAVGVIVFIFGKWEMIPIRQGILQYLTKIAGEIYILHIPVCFVLRMKFVSDAVFIIWVCIITLLLSAVFYFINCRVKELIQKIFYHKCIFRVN